MPMPIFKKKNEDFFKIWSGDMAYVLGFFAADGSMYVTRRKTHFIEFQITDRDLLYGIRALLGADHRITERHRYRQRKTVYRLQIGSKAIFQDLSVLGFMQNKTFILRLPDVPEDYFGDFLRGYFDGDGNVVYGYWKRADRKTRSRTLSARFTSGSKGLLDDIKNRLTATAGLSGSLYFSGSAWRLNYGPKDSRKIFTIMYPANVGGLIYLERKYKIFQSALHMRV
jgi:hypothetical protein